MRTRLFLAFLAVILTALVSNLIFESLIIGDFKDYAEGVREDRLYLVLASVEGGYSEEGWNMEALADYLHLAAMMGFDVQVLDADGNSVMTTGDSLKALTPTMKRRLDTVVELASPEEEYEYFPLFSGGKEIGALMARPLQKKGHLREKEEIFKHRGRDFMLISFLIAGGGALILSLLFSQLLTGPVQRLRKAAGIVASGDLTVRVDAASSDELGDLARSFNHMVEALQRDGDLRQRLAQNIAHELRTPLAIVKSHIEAISDGVIECRPEEMGKLSAEIDRLITLVKGIEDITKAEASFFGILESEDVAIRDVLEGVINSLSHMIKDKGLSVDFAAQGEDVELRARTDTGKLETILRNIVTNAVNYTDKGGITLKWGREGADSFYIEIRDSGRGISQEDLPQIFRRFHRGEGSNGVGLGLAIAKELAEVMGGGIEAQAGKDGGSVFRVVLPLDIKA